MQELPEKYYRSLGEIPIAHYFLGVLQGKMQYLNKLDFYLINEKNEIPENWQEISEKMLSEVPKVDFKIINLEKEIAIFDFKYIRTGEAEYLNRRVYFENLLKNEIEKEEKQMNISDLMQSIAIIETNIEGLKIDIFKDCALKFFAYQNILEQKSKLYEKQNNRV